MSRVLIGDFGKIVLLGLEDLLEEEKMEVVRNQHSDDQIAVDIAEILPDVVVLDLDHHGLDTTASDIAQNFPAVTVIACSSVEPLMRVFPRFHHGEYYEATLSPKEFLHAVKSKS